MSAETPVLPRNTPLQNNVVFDLDLAAKLFQTYARLYALAWRHEYRYTDWLTMDELESRLGMDRATIFRHIGELKQLNLIRWDAPVEKRYRFFFLEVRLAPVALSQHCDSTTTTTINPSFPDEKAVVVADQSQYCDSQSCDCLDPEAYQALLEAGLGKATAREWSNYPHVTARYVRAQYARARQKGGNVPGWLITFLRDEDPMPEWCEACEALDGEHAPDCPTQAERRAREAAEQERLLRDAERAEREQEAKRAKADAPHNGPQTFVMPESLIRGQRVPLSEIALTMEDGQVIQAGQVWQSALGELQLQLTGATYNTWLGRTQLISSSIENGAVHFVIGVHNGYAKDWLEHRLLSMIQRTLAGIVHHPVEISFVVRNTELEFVAGMAREERPA